MAGMLEFNLTFRAPQNAFSALKLAITKHSGNCFYCKTASAEQLSDLDLTIDVIETQSIGGTHGLAKLVVACKPCIQKKGQSRIDAFKASTTDEWLTSLKNQIEDRFKNLNR